MNGWRSRVPLLAVLAVALVLRLYIWKRTGVYLYGDMLRYNAMAQNLVLHGYLGAGSGPDAFVTPLYPLFVALLYKLSMWLHGGVLLSQHRVVHEIFLAQQLVSVVTVWMTYELARFFGGRAVGLVAAILSFVYLPNSFLGMMLLTEVLFVPLLIGTLLAFALAERTDRPLFFALSGFLMGLTVLARPNVLPVVVVLVGCDLWRRHVAGRETLFADPALRRRWLQSSALLAGVTVLTLVPWWIRNWIDFHKFIPLSTEAGNPLLAGADPYNRINIDTLIEASRRLHETQQTYAIHYALAGFEHHFWLFAGWYLFGKLPYLFAQPWTYAYLPWFVQLHQTLAVAGGLAMLPALALPRVRPTAWTAVLLLLIQLFFLPLPRYGYPIMALWMIALPAVLYAYWRRLRDGEPLMRERIES